tara:strand:- start:149 stop:436 length:288 start_codon:yes stop_codon:yes gene_type:complete
MEMKTFYNFRLFQPNNKINISIKQSDNTGVLLIATQVGKRIKLDSKNLFSEFLTHPLMSFKVIMAIHFEAFRLWIKGVKLVKKTIKRTNNLSLEN